MNRLFIIALLVLTFTASAVDWDQKDLTIFGAPGSIDPVLNSTEATFDFAAIQCTTEVKCGTFEAFNVNGITFTDDGGNAAIDIADGSAVTINPDGGDRDFTIEGDHNSTLFVSDASADKIIISGTTEIDATDHVFYADTINNRVGIGTASPAYQLDLCNASTAALGLTTAANNDVTRLVFKHNGSAVGYIQQLGKAFAGGARDSNIEIWNVISTGEVSIHVNNSATPAFTVAADGDLFYWSAPSGTGNDLELTGNEIVENTSMAADKRDFEDYSLSADKKAGLLSLKDKIKKYDRCDQPDRVKKEIGLTAEDVFSAFPDLCNYDNEGNLIGVRYKMAGFYLIPIVAEHDEKIAELEARIAVLEKH